MKKKRSLILLFFSASLPWSPLALSTDKSHSFSAASIQLSTLSATRAEHTLANLTDTDNKASLSNSAADSIIDTPVIDTHAVDHEKLDTQASTDEEREADDITVETPVIEKQTESTQTEHQQIEDYFSDEELSQLRKLFLQAEEAIKRNNEAEYRQLASELEGYPLYAYLQYQWLKKHLNNSDEVKHFIKHNQESRFARPLKQKWLYRLAKKKQWQTFLENYDETSDTSLKCYHHRAQYHVGEKQAALKGARKLWSVGRSQPKACDPLFAQLKKSKFFDHELLWTRFEASLSNNKYSLAKYVKKQMAQPHRAKAELWLKLHRNPDRHLSELYKNPKAPKAGLMFSHAISRLSGSDLEKAITTWDDNKHLFDIDSKQANKLDRKLAFKLVLRNEAGAYERLSQLDDADRQAREWRVRAALYEQNWPRVVDAIEDLSESDQEREKWQYWLARAYAETGNTVQADLILNELSATRNFYGYMAADKVNSLYQLAHDPIKVTPGEIKAVKDRDEFRVAFELMVLDRELEAKRQWWHALGQLNKDEIMAAAKLAQQWQWDEIAIFTIAKVKHWDDVEMRFPISYSDKILENAQLQNLNPAILFGLVRRESAFNKDAHSPAGAHGLMQIMPQTGKQIARDLKERWTGKRSLYNPVKNLKYGSYYYQKLLTQFDGNYALALAAYNAGPNKVKKWLPDETLPADIWIETIPYRETREYVTSVLAYALIYQQRMQSNGLTMGLLTGEVQPLALNP